MTLESIGQDDPRLDADWLRQAPRHDPDGGAATWPHYVFLIATVLRAAYEHHGTLEA